MSPKNIFKEYFLALNKVSPESIRFEHHQSVDFDTWEYVRILIDGKSYIFERYSWDTIDTITNSLTQVIKSVIREKSNGR